MICVDTAEVCVLTKVMTLHVEVRQEHIYVFILGRPLAFS